MDVSIVAVEPASEAVSLTEPASEARECASDAAAEKSGTGGGGGGGSHIARASGEARVRPCGRGWRSLAVFPRLRCSPPRVTAPPPSTWRSLHTRRAEALACCTHPRGWRGPRCAQPPPRATMQHSGQKRQLAPLTSLDTPLDRMPPSALSHLPALGGDEERAVRFVSTDHRRAAPSRSRRPAAAWTALAPTPHCIAGPRVPAVLAPSHL